MSVFGHGLVHGLVLWAGQTTVVNLDLTYFPNSTCMRSVPLPVIMLTHLVFITVTSHRSLGNIRIHQENLKKLNLT